MHLLDRRTIFVSEHVGLLKLTGAYDLLDPQTKEKIGIAQEKISGWQKFLRLLVKKAMLPTRVEIAVAEGQPALLVLTRGFTFFRSKVLVLDGAGTQIGYLRSKFFSLGGGFHVFSTDDQKFAEVKGDWKGWNFRLVDVTGREMGIVTKKWAGIGKEFFTNADQYVIEVKESGSSNALVLAAALAIDIVFKERQG
ncbi:MAG: phospholipid scramblase-related protein [Nibricoccus sp.]